MKKAKISIIIITIQFSFVYQRARRIQPKHNRQWSRACSVPRCKLYSTLYRIVEWKITDVRCDIVLCLSLIMASNSYCCTKELHCGGWRDIPPGLCQFPLAQRHSSGNHHSKRDAGAALADGYRAVKSLLYTQQLLTDCNIHVSESSPYRPTYHFWTPRPPVIR